MLAFPRPVAFGLAALCAGCGGEQTPPSETVATDIALTRIDPGLLLPGSEIVLGGSNFVPDLAGPSTLHLEGSLAGEAVRIALPARFEDYDRMHSEWPGALDAGLPAPSGRFQGEAYLSATSTLDGLEHRSAPLAVTLDIANELVPQLDAIENGVLFVNDPVIARGQGFLLGGSEGQTFAVVEGCFTLRGQTSCQPVGPAEIPAEPLTPFDRRAVVFPFAPNIAGIRPGSFSGTVQLVNRHGPLAGAIEHATASLPTDNEIIEPAIASVSPSAASLGQYVDIAGGGFVGPLPGGDPTQAFTLIELDGTFTPAGGTPAPASLTLVPEFKSGQLVRYVINEEDGLGQALDLRKEAGRFSGTATPEITFESDTVTGTSSPVTFEITHVKQVVWLRFLPSYVESLRHFGLRAVDFAVRERVLQVVRRDFAGVNLEVRTERPEDFALFSEVEIAGPDPNGIGLLGYDNTPGKDDGNLRLFDKIGGVNALTQLDGYPGYGGIFVESLFAFSQHPGALAQGNDGADPVFDQLFDPFRPDVGGSPVSGGELSGLSPLGSGEVCPAGDRPTQIDCAVWALGSLIGTTVSHEIAHSLGLADPGGEAFHNSGDWPNALMDAGGARSFRERAEVLGEGPGRFCSINYSYLRTILPSSDPDPLPSRTECY